MLTGIAYALGAGLIWGLVFIVPLLLPDYPGFLLSFGRYLAFGVVALIPAWIDRRRIRRLTRADWLAALRLSIVGNLLYYAALATAIQLAGAPLPAMLIGTLPVILSICANRAAIHAGTHIAWARLMPSLVLLSLGLLLVNWSELRHLDSARSSFDYLAGLALTVVALASWTWYPIHNARYLRAQPHIGAATWATVQGLAILPLTLPGFIGYGWYASLQNQDFIWPFGPQAPLFLALMLASGLGASWLGTLLWNQASRRLPASLAGQLIVFETLAALAYAFVLRETWPPLSVIAAVVLLCAGVMLGVRAFTPRKD